MIIFEFAACALRHAFTATEQLAVNLRATVNSINFWGSQLIHSESDFTPLTPDAETAREIARDELSRLKYQRDETLLIRFMNWLEALIKKVFSAKSGDYTLSEILTLITLGILLFVLIFFAFRFGIRWRRQKVRRNDFSRRKSLFFDDDRTASELRAAADKAVASGDLNTAVVERFRAAIKDLDERKIISLRPGLTALEATELAAQTLGERDLFFATANWFNDIFYGSKQADASALDSATKLLTFVSAFVPRQERNKAEKSEMRRQQAVDVPDSSRQGAVSRAFSKANKSDQESKSAQNGAQ